MNGDIFVWENKRDILKSKQDDRQKIINEKLSMKLYLRHKKGIQIFF